MRKLLTANFMRMIKNKTFLVEIALMFAYGIFCVLVSYFDGYYSLDGTVESYPVMIGFVSAVFVSVFLGTEYAEGTIRNKLIVGYTRAEIYFSNLIISIIAAFLMCISFSAAACVLGIPLLGFFETPLKEVIPVLCGLALTMVAFAALYTMISMLDTNKMMAGIILVAGFFVLLIASFYIQSRLDEGEYVGVSYVNEDGERITEEYKNPDYVSGTKRVVYEFLDDFLPTGQVLQYQVLTADLVDRLWQKYLYAVLIIAASSGFGVSVFRKKNIR